MGHVRKLWIEGAAGRLEAALRGSEAPRASAVLAHPHPLHGGTLHNPVVFRADRALNRSGFATLRFNFRGTGSSDGEHDGGRGEVDDVAAAVGWLQGLVPALPLVLVGYSFGALCAMRHARRDARVVALVTVGLPVRHYDFADLTRFDRPLAVVQGSEDELGTPDEVRSLLADAPRPADVRVVEGATHLFSGRAREAAREIAAAATSLLAGV